MAKYFALVFAVVGFLLALDSYIPFVRAGSPMRLRLLLMSCPVCVNLVNTWPSKSELWQIGLFFSCLNALLYAAVGYLVGWSFQKYRAARKS